MAENSKIEWTDHTFNPWWGCTKVSPGCDNCYAAAFDKRVGGDHWGPGKDRRYFEQKHWNEPLRWNIKAGRLGRRERVFCASMADVFDNEAIPTMRNRLWELIKATGNLDWILVTKRIGNAADMLPPEWMRDGLPSNIWLLITVVNQTEADRDIPKLLKIPAKVRGLSCEPLLGPINFRWTPYAHQASGETYNEYLNRCGSVNEYEALRKISWVIVGGESGHHARPMHPDWARQARDQCADAGVPFFFKQWGEWAPFYYREDGDPLKTQTLDDGQVVHRIGKAPAGRYLDGALYDGMPA